MKSVYSTAPPGWLGQRTLVEGVLPLCRDAVGVFYVTHRPTRPKYTRWGCLTPLQRWIRCILLSPRPDRLGQRKLVEGALARYRDAVGVFYSTRLGRLGQRTLVEGVLPLFRDAVSVLYSLGQCLADEEFIVPRTFQWCAISYMLQHICAENYTIMQSEPSRRRLTTSN